MVWLLRCGDGLMGYLHNDGPPPRAVTMERQLARHLCSPRSVAKRLEWTPRQNPGWFSCVARLTGGPAAAPKYSWGKTNQSKTNNQSFATDRARVLSFPFQLNWL